MSDSEAQDHDTVMYVPEDVRTKPERMPAVVETDAPTTPTTQSAQVYNRIDDSIHEESQITQQVDPHKVGSQSGTMQSSHEVALLKKQLSDATAAAAAKDRRLLELEGRLRQKDTEIESLKNFLSTHNDSSDADVSDQLDRINNLVEEFAVSVSVKLTDAKYQPSSQRMETAYSRYARDVLGTPLVQALHDATPDFEFASLLLQFTFQSAILRGMAQVLSQFVFYIPELHGTSPGGLDNKFYKSLGGDILKGELQSSYGHWRSMTHQYLRKSFATEKLQRLVDDFVARRQKECYQYSLFLFKDAPPSPEVFNKESLAPMKEIMEATLRLVTIIRENVITRNYEAHLPEYKTPFSGESMEAEDGDGERTRHKHVVCVTALGLSYSSKSGREGELGQTVFKKAKVLTEDVLAEFSPSNSERAARKRGSRWYKFGFR